MPYLTKDNVTVRNVNGDTYTHPAGTVISDWEVSDFIRDKIKEGSEHYRTLFEPLLEHEAESYRVKATKAEGPRYFEGEQVDPPWDDYVGLHPTEITDRMRSAELETVQQAKKYEQAGMNRQGIVEFVTPAEREPFPDYDEKSTREVLDKFTVLSAPAIADAIAYEKAHKNRVAIVEYDETYEPAQTQETAQIAAAT